MQYQQSGFLETLPEYIRDLEKVLLFMSNLAGSFLFNLCKTQLNNVSHHKCDIITFYFCNLSLEFTCVFSTVTVLCPCWRDSAKKKKTPRIICQRWCDLKINPPRMGNASWADFHLRPASTEKKKPKDFKRARVHASL